MEESLITRRILDYLLTERNQDFSIADIPRNSKNILSLLRFKETKTGNVMRV